MSVKPNPDGSVTVRWRDPSGHRSRKLTALQLERMVRENAGLPTSTIRNLSEDWWEKKVRDKAESTQKLYDWMLNAFVLPHLADVECGDMNPLVVEDWLAVIDTPPATKRKALAVLHQILNRAVKAGEIRSNPCELADKPALPDSDPIEPPSPLVVESLRSKAEPRDAMLISLMAYAGLAPVDALNVGWNQWRDGVLSGRRQKTGKPYRFPAGRVLPSLAADLSAFRDHTGATTLSGPIIPPGPAWDNWRKRTWRDQLGADFRPYDLRHTAVSLWLRDPDVTRVEASEWAGHGLDQQDRYGHVLDAGPQRAEDAIQAARQQVWGVAV